MRAPDDAPAEPAWHTSDAVVHTAALAPAVTARVHRDDHGRWHAGVGGADGATGWFSTAGTHADLASAQRAAVAAYLRRRGDR